MVIDVVARPPQNGTSTICYELLPNERPGMANGGNEVVLQRVPTEHFLTLTILKS